MANEEPTDKWWEKRAPKQPTPAVVHMLIEAMEHALVSCPAMSYASGSDVASAVFTLAARTIQGALMQPNITMEERMVIQQNIVETCERLWRIAAGVAPDHKPEA